MSMLGIRQLSKTEHVYTIMFYYTASSLIVSVILMCFYWRMPDAHTFLLLIVLGISGVLYQEFWTRALTYAPVRIPSAFVYSSIVFSAIFDLIIWGQIPDLWSWVGIILVCVGNIWVVIMR